MSQSHSENKPSGEAPIWTLQVPADRPAKHRVDAHLRGRCADALRLVTERGDIGFTRFLSREALLQAIETRAREIGRTATHLVVVGMGGSSLGAKALLTAVPKPPGRGSVTFLDNIDADRFWPWLRARHDLGSVHWLIVSKSGSTIETLMLADFIDQYLRQAGHRRLGTVATVISETAQNPLTKWAHKENVPVLEIPVDVGGRFSALTAVGLLPAAYMGLKLDRVTQGVRFAMSANETVADMAAISLAGFLREEWVTMLWSYADGLREFGSWWQQLWAESLAKKANRSGGPASRVSTPIPAIGAADQHSLLQQVIEGAPDKMVWFHRVAASEEAGPLLERTLFEGQDYLVGRGLGEVFAAEAEATERAMNQVGVATARLETKQLDERSMAALFMLWQLTIATMGEVLDINAFDQPGVELGKKLAKQVLTR